MSVYVTIFILSIIGALTLPLCADYEVSDCGIDLKIHRGTHHLASVGEGLRMACPVQFCDGTAPTVTWFKLETEHRTPVTLSERVTTEWTVIHDNKGILFLSFHNVLSRDSGLYWCESGSDVSHHIQLSVVCETDANQHNTFYNVTTGDKLTITCPICDYFPPTVAWFKYERGQHQSVKQDGRVTTEWERLNNSDGISSLIFQNVLTKDAGEYYCESGSHVQHSIVVSVGCEIDSYHSYNSTVGDKLAITCPVCEKIPLTVIWYKNTTEGFRRVNLSDRVKTSNNSNSMPFLIFHKLLSRDSGQYLCSGGSENHTIEIHVIDSPAPHYDWSFLYHSVGLIVCCIIIVCVYVVLKKRKDAAVLKASNVRSTSTDPRHDSLNEQNHMYESFL